MATTYELIASVTLGTAATDIEFTSIPGTFDDALVVCSLRSDRTGDRRDRLDVTINGDTGSNYSVRTLVYDNGSASSGSASTTYFNMTSCLTAADTTSDTFSSIEIYIPNYAGATNKSISATVAGENNNSLMATMGAVAGLWSSTSAITSIKFAPGVGTNFIANSTAYLYGITKA